MNRQMGGGANDSVCGDARSYSQEAEEINIPSVSTGSPWSLRKRRWNRHSSLWTENWQKQALDQEGLMGFLLHY